MKRVMLPILTAFMILASVGILSADTLPLTEIRVEVTYGQTNARKMLGLINTFRTGSDAWAYDMDGSVNRDDYRNLQKLTYDYELEKVAMLRAVEAAVVFSHTRPDGQSCFSAGGWGTSNNVYGSRCGENLALGSASYEDTFVQWREDDRNYSGQGHRRNMLDSRYTSIGIGHVVLGGTHFWVQEFGDAGHSGSTAANDSKETVTVSVAESSITWQGGLLTEDGTESMTVTYGKTATLPAVVRRCEVKNEGGSSWNPVNAIVSPTWKSGNTAVASLSGGKVKGNKAGSTNLKASLGDDAIWIPVTVKAASLASADVTVSNCYFNGSARKPAAKVVLGGKTLTSGTDYTLTYANNVHAGKGKVTVKGRGNYAGSAEGTFTIARLDLADGGYSVPAISARYYTGSEVKPSFTLVSSVSGAPVPAAGTDYTVSYANNVKTGTASLTVTGKGDYKGTLTGTFRIRYRSVGTSMTVSGNVYKITKAGASGTAEVSFEKVKDTTLTSVTIPVRVRYAGVNYKVTSVAARALEGNKKAASVSVGDNVAVIGAYAFCNMPALKKVVIGTGIRTVGRRAFYNAKALSSFTVRSLLLKQSEVAGEAFAGNSAKAVYYVPESKVAAYRYIIRTRGNHDAVVKKAA